MALMDDKIININYLKLSVWNYGVHPPGIMKIPRWGWTFSVFTWFFWNMILTAFCLGEENYRRKAPRCDCPSLTCARWQHEQIQIFTGIKELPVWKHLAFGNEYSEPSLAFNYILPFPPTFPFSMSFFYSPLCPCVRLVHAVPMKSWGRWHKTDWFSWS